MNLSASSAAPHRSAWRSADAVRRDLAHVCTSFNGSVEFAHDQQLLDHDDALAPAVLSRHGDIEPFARLLAARIERAIQMRDDARDLSSTQAAPTAAVPGTSQAPGFQAGYWLRPLEDAKGTSLVLFDTEQNADTGRRQRSIPAGRVHALAASIGSVRLLGT